MAARSLTCGTFTAWPPFGAGTSWRLTCSKLPGWEEWVDDEATARRAIHDLQAHFRGTWEAATDASALSHTRRPATA